MNYEVKYPILGLADIQSVELEKNDGLTTMLKSDQKNINMTLINAHVGEETFEIPAGIRTLLDINKDTNYSVYFTVVMEENIENSLINLGAPMIFNEDNKTMAQCVISDDHTQVSELE